MGYSGKESVESVLIPQEGDTTINIPVSFSVSEGRRATGNFRNVSAILLGLGSLLYGIFITFFGDGFFLINLIFGFFVNIGTIVFIRFFLFKEASVRNNEVSLIDKDYQRKSTDFWNIFDIAEEYPYFCHYKNGAKGVFVAFEKDVIVGVASKLEYIHRDAVGDAYNMAASNNLEFCHTDYMDNLGSDVRIDGCLQDLDVEGVNEDIQEVVFDIFTNLKKNMSKRASTFDVYLFYSVGMSDNAFVYALEKVLDVMMTANYSSFEVLSEDGLRGLVKPVFNINNFSARDAMTDTFDVDEGILDVSVISVVGPDGVETIVNKTKKEKEVDAKKRREARELEKKDKKGKSSKKNGKKGNKKKGSGDVSDNIEDVWDDIV